MRSTSMIHVYDHNDLFESGIKPDFKVFTWDLLHSMDRVLILSTMRGYTKHSDLTV